MVDPQGSQLAVELLAKEEGLSLEAVCALNEGFALASREYAGYLAARTYEQVREASNRETPVDTMSDAAAHRTSSDFALRGPSTWTRVVRFVPPRSDPVV